VSRTRVVHVINSFGFGGAEAMLCNLLLRTDRERFDVSVVALIDDMSVAAPVLEARIPLVTMGMSPGVPDPRGILRLARHLVRVRPDVVQTWMDHSNLIGAAAAALAGFPHVIWGVHHSNHVPALTKRSTLFTVNACSWLSRSLVSRIVFCSEHARTLYARRGFAPGKMRVIPNGFDTARFRPDADARRAVRDELGVAAGAPLVGLVARYDRFKDHATFVRAAARVARDVPAARFVLCGAGVDRNNPALASLIEAAGIGEQCHLLGPRGDVPRLLAAFDVLASSSVSEAFPLVLGEAMACGVPCAATDVGDSALIVGPTGRIVPPQDPASLAAALTQLLALPGDDRRRLGDAARARVCRLFDLGAVTRQYERLYESLVAAPARRKLERPLAEQRNAELVGATQGGI
jgi:glycosyltransferase involved in cell wall biosynthesis